MPQTRKLVRDAIREALAASTGGFNEAIANIASAYGISAFTINWAATDSPSFVMQQRADPAASDDNRLVRGISAALYTSEAVTLPAGQREKFTTFHGNIRANLDFHIEYNAGMEASEDLMEPVGDAIEDAVLRVLCTPTGSQFYRFSGDVQWTGDYLSNKLPIEETADGHLQVMQFSLVYEISV